MTDGVGGATGIGCAALPRPRPVPPTENIGLRAPGPSTPVTGHAWLLRDVTHVPGVLRLEGGRLSFVSTRRTIFDATPAALGLVVPRTRRGTFALVLDGERVGLAVVRPPGAVPVPTEVVARAGGPEPTTGDRDAARRWHALLAPQAVVRPWPVRRALARLAPARGPAASELV